ncbi:hypothetical protein D3Z42_14485 [Lachnospiraceae bacterium]|nr:hypothetical protein [Lachnospiraceae bacterium]NBI76643.1 hypothetical protein [Lachnospiraceae bacterium]
MAGINQDETAFSAYLENMGAYVQNKSRGHWVDFPVPLERLAGIRAEIGGEEQIILDYDIPEKYAFLQDAVSEYSNLEQLNLAGAILQRLSEQSLEAVEAYAASGGSLGLPELMNLMVQADDIPYFPYQFEGIENAGELSPEEAYGYMKVGNQMQELQEMLGKHGMEEYLDYEAIGRDAGMNGEADLYDKGYVDMAADGPDLGLYTMDELKAEYGMARETVQDPQKEAQGMDRQEELRGPSI